MKNGSMVVIHWNLRVMLGIPLSIFFQRRIFEDGRGTKEFSIDYNITENDIFLELKIVAQGLYSVLEFKTSFDDDCVR